MGKVKVVPAQLVARLGNVPLDGERVTGVLEPLVQNLPYLEHGTYQLTSLV